MVIPMSNRLIDLVNISKSFGSSLILDEMNLYVRENEFLTLLGPSGCGKTTTLRVIAGLIEPKDGAFILDQENLTKVPVHKRNFGMVFQSYALFPHMTIAENVAFGLKLRKENKSAIQQNNGGKAADHIIYELAELKNIL